MRPPSRQITTEVTNLVCPVRVSSRCPGREGGGEVTLLSDEGVGVGGHFDLQPRRCLSEFLQPPSPTKSPIPNAEQHSQPR
jgi:hypothetical protein